MPTRINSSEGVRHPPAEHYGVLSPILVVPLQLLAYPPAPRRGDGRGQAAQSG